jgi:hypothetical protein
VDHSADDALTSRKDLAMIGVCLDRSRAAAEALAKQHPDWIICWSAQGITDPAIQPLGLVSFPVTIVFDPQGRVVSDDHDPLVPTR